MKSRLAILAILVAGCRNGHTPSPAPGDAIGATLGAAAPSHFSDLAPGDTAAVIAMMRQTMQDIDAGLATMTKRDTVIQPASDSLMHHLTAWSDNGVIRKLSVIDTTTTGNQGETDVWFVGGDVAVIQTVSEIFAFDEAAIVLWTDGAFTPRSDVSQQMMMDRQSTLIEQVRAWLAVFGIQLP